MLKPAIIMLLTAVAFPALAASRVTVEQLEQTLAATHGKRDSVVAKQLAGLELTERLSTAKLSSWEGAVRGRKAQQALTALADSSAFLDLPAAELPQADAPDAKTQQQIISLAAVYVVRSMHSLPNFWATRVTTRFAGIAEDSANSGLTTDAKGFRYVDGFGATVLYRDGEEIVKAAENKKDIRVPYYGLSNFGVFGPILRAVMADVGHGRITWSHWEGSAADRIAVFHYVVPESESHYDVKYCCVSIDRGMFSFSGMPGSFEATPAYHGELAVEPATGNILRLVAQPELEADLPIVRDDVVVEYGPVVIGGQTYICPTKSIAISKAEAGGASAVGPPGSKGTIPKVTALNDVVFSDYHVFRANVRMLTGSGVPLP